MVRKQGVAANSVIWQPYRFAWHDGVTLYMSAGSDGLTHHSAAPGTTSSCIFNTYSCLFNVSAIASLCKLQPPYTQLHGST
jgi:hypothetical protein